MVGERFDSGGVLSRARPVLTFATVVRGETLPSANARSGTPIPVPMSWSGPPLPRRHDLPVLPRIVRRTAMEQLVEPFARAAHAVRRGGGMLLFGALGLATMGTIVALGLRSLPDEPTPVVSGAAHAFDATATERLLARAPQAVRVEWAAPPPAVTPAPRVAAVALPVPARMAPAPAHPGFSTHAAKKRASASALARR
jgi:hypothetical protein